MILFLCLLIGQIEDLDIVQHKQEQILLEMKEKGLTQELKTEWIVNSNKGIAIVKNKSELFASIEQNLTFYNVIWVISAVIVVLSASALINIYLKKFILLINPLVWEITCLLTCVSLIALDIFYVKSMYLLLPASIGLFPCLVLSSNLHLKRIHVDTRVSIIHFILMPVWSLLAFYCSSQILAFMGVIAFEVALGFSIFVAPAVISLGYGYRDYIARLTLSSFVLISAFVINAIYPNIPGVFYNAIFAGTFSYFIGLLIISSKFYCRTLDKKTNKYKLNLRYVTSQVVTILSGILAIYLGSEFNIPILSNISVIFFYVYLIEKYYEIPWSGKGWAWSLLGLGFILYIFLLSHIYMFDAFQKMVN